MSIVVKITEVFPTGYILAVGQVHLQSLNIVAEVYLKFDDSSSQYKVEFPPASVGHEFAQECDDDLFEKLLNAMVFKYEEYILTKTNEDVFKSLPYIFWIEKKRIEHRNKHHQQRYYF